MQKVISKYILRRRDAEEWVTRKVWMPIGAELLHVAVQNGHVWLWARVDPEAPNGDREFRLAFEGEELDTAAGDAPYVGSVRIDVATLYHILDLGEK